MGVSRVIIRGGYVSAEVRRRVQRAIDKIEYHPNARARSLKSQRTHVVRILLPHIKNPFSAELAGRIQRYCWNEATRHSSALPNRACSANNRRSAHSSTIAW